VTFWHAGRPAEPRQNGSDRGGVTGSPARSCCWSLSRQRAQPGNGAASGNSFRGRGRLRPGPGHPRGNFHAGAYAPSPVIVPDSGQRCRRRRGAGRQSTTCQRRSARGRKASRGRAPGRSCCHPAVIGDRLNRLQSCGAWCARRRADGPTGRRRDERRSTTCASRRRATNA